MIEVQKIAPGHDNPAGLLKLRELSPPLFRRFRMPLKTIWHEAEGRREDALGRPRNYGVAWVEWIIGGLTLAERAYLAALGREVTIYTFDRTNNAWGTFNAIMTLELLGEGDEWLYGIDVAPYSIIHRELEALEP